MPKLKAMILIEYDVVPEHYDDPDPRKMIELDIKQDPAFILQACDWTVVSAVLDG